jgi:light-regulated signal transduction histidine kinase (bacteriophytochrome)
VRAAPGPNQDEGSETPPHETTYPAASDARSGIAPSGATHALLTALLSSARHELRSPLQSIQGFAELLHSESYGQLVDEQRTFVEHIVQGSTELGAVLEACLALAELEALGAPFSSEERSLRVALDDAIAASAKRSRTTVSITRCDLLEALRLPIDQESLERALCALFTGMCSATQRSLELRIEASATQVQITVSRVGSSAAQLFSLTELAQLKRMSRGLIWLRLADILLDKQGGVLRVGERGDRAEIRIELGETT